MDDRDLDDGRPAEPLAGTSQPPLSRRAAKRAAREARGLSGAVPADVSSGSEPEAEPPTFFSAPQPPSPANAAGSAGGHLEVSASSPEAFLEDSTAAEQARLRGLPPAGGPFGEVPASLDAPAAGRLDGDAPRLTPVPSPSPRPPATPPVVRGPSSVPPPRDFRDGDRRLGREAAGPTAAQRQEPEKPPAEALPAQSAAGPEVAPVAAPASPPPVAAQPPPPRAPAPAARQASNDPSPTQAFAAVAGSADPELLPPRKPAGGGGSGGDYAPPPPIRKRRLSATARFYLGFWTALVLVLALAAAIGYKIGASSGEAGARAAATRTLGLEAQCLRDVKLSPPPAADRFSPAAYARDVYALAQANRCARQHGLPYLSAADLEELSGVKTDPASSDLAPPSDPRWLKPEADPPRAGAATGASVRSGALGR